MEKIKKWYRGLPDKKRYIEFITAILSVPVLLTVLISNISNIQRDRNSSKTVAPATTPVPEKIIVITEKPVIASPSPTLATTLNPTPTTAECKREVGPVKISKPQENELVTTDSVCIDVSYDNPAYCSVTWSYRVNGGGWSNPMNKNFCLDDLVPGPVELDLNVESTVSNDELTLVRNFFYISKEKTSTSSSAIVTP